MTVTTWNKTTINGVDYLVVEVAQFRIPLDWDPSSNMFFAVAAPTGGLGNIPALLKGDPGDAATLDDVINFTPLEYTDPTGDSASFTELSPGLYQLNLALHKGPPGADGTSLLDPTAYGTPVSKKILIVNPAGDGFIYQSQKVGDRYIPASLNSTPAGNANYTLGICPIPAQDSDWRPDIEAGCIVTGTSSDVRVDIVARLNNETAGNIVGRAFGTTGINPPPHKLISAPPAGSTDTYDRVAAGSAANIYLRAERQTGTGTFTTSNSTTLFAVKVRPVP